MSFSFFILGFLFTPDMLWWWWADRKLKGRRGPRIALLVFMLAMVVHVLWILLWPETARRSHEWLPRGWIAAAYLWHLLVLPIALLYAAGDTVVRLLRRREAPTDTSRRRLLAVCAAFTPPVATCAGVVAALPSLNDFRVRRLDVPLVGLPEALDGTTIAHVSDIHYGKFTEPDAVDAVVHTVNGLDADLVLFTGDLIDLSLNDLPAAIEMVGRFRQPPFLCEGNHDRIDDGAEFEALVRRAGLRLLRDEVTTVEVRGERVQILGARWSRNRRDAVARVRAQRDRRAFPILLAHHPHCFDLAKGIPLTLSGHTHGGQLMWNERLGAGPVMFRYWSGAYRSGTRALVVSNGIGNWFPVRTHAPAEVALLTLRRPLG